MRQATTDLVGRPSPPTKTFDGVLCFWPWLMSCLPTSTRAVGLPVRPRNDNDQRQAWLPNRRLPTAHSHSGPHREDNVRDLINHHTWSFSILHTWPHLILRSLNQSNQVDKKKINQVTCKCNIIFFTSFIWTMFCSDLYLGGFNSSKYIMYKLG